MVTWFLLALALVGIVACNENTSPTASAGANQNVSTGVLVSLDGSMSLDADRDPLTYYWSFVSTPANSAATLSDRRVSNPSFTADIKGLYVISLMVNDGMLDSTADTVNIVVTDLALLSAPVGLQATVISSSQIDLSWTTSSYNTVVAAYNIYRNGLFLTSTTGTTYSDTDLSSDVTYIYTVSVMDDAGNESLQSDPVSAITRVLFVATDGNDSTGDGSNAKPWASITYALDSAPDGSTILVKPGTYNGRVRIRGTFPIGITIRSQIAYLARLRSNTMVITAYGHSSGCSGITIEGFDVTHNDAAASPLVIHIDGGGTGKVHNITIKNNLLHDSYNNDILKINNAAHNIVVAGNMFYNQTGSDEHIDINSVEHVIVQDNIFLNNFAASGRINNNDTSSYIGIKDSNGDNDAYVGSQHITVRRNVFLNWEGSTGSNFVLIGEDGKSYHEARDVLVENNLMLGNASNTMRAAFGVKGGKDIVFRHNTIAGDLPALAYAMRLNTEGSNPANNNIQFYNNVWSDPTATMGYFSDTPIGETAAFTLHNNLYWNGSAMITQAREDLINYTDDSNAVIDDPFLGSQSNIILPHWNSGETTFADGSSTIREVFNNLVERYGKPGESSPVINAADPSHSSVEDILGKPRPAGTFSDIGAYEYTAP